MSYQLGDACFETVGAAAKAAAAASIGQVLPAGGSAYVVNAVGAADGSVSYTLHELGTSATLTHTYTPAYPDCVLLGVIAAWVLAWAVLAIRRALV
jgi:sorbitol-specific phosphotransferase system component IIA